MPRNQRSKSCADEAVSAKEINDEPVWLQTRRLDPERVTELFQVLLEALRLSRCRSQTTDVELFIKDQRVPIKNLDWRQLESLLAPEWPAANSSKPLWEIELDYEHRSTPRVRVFRDVEGGVESVNVRFDELTQDKL